MTASLNLLGEELRNHVKGSHRLLSNGYCADCDGSCLVGFGNPDLAVEVGGLGGSLHWDGDTRTIIHMDPVAVALVAKDVDPTFARWIMEAWAAEGALQVELADVARDHRLMGEGLLPDTCQTCLAAWPCSAERLRSALAKDDDR